MSHERDELAEIITNADWRTIEQVAGEVLAGGYRKPRTIATAEELDALPDRSVILDRDGDAWQRMGSSGWTCAVRALNTSEQPSGSLACVLGPATVLHAPEES